MSKADFNETSKITDGSNINLPEGSQIAEMKNMVSKINELNF